jgi:hypothetical protein
LDKVGEGSSSNDNNDNNNNGDDNSNNSSGIANNLVAKWYQRQTEADAEKDLVIFEITAEGKMIGEAFNTEVKVTTSNGRITATTTANGQTISDSADYVVEGTTLKFSNLSTQTGYFAILNNVLTTAAMLEEAFGLAPTIDGKYHKKAGSSDNNSGSGGNKLAITGISATVYGYGEDGAMIGVFTPGKTLSEVLEGEGLVAGSDLEDAEITSSGSLYTITVPLYDLSDDYSPWTGTGTFDIYVVLFGGGGHFYKASSIKISSGTTTLSFSKATEFTPPPDTEIPDFGDGISGGGEDKGGSIPAGR